MAKDISLTNPGKRKKSSSNVPLHEEKMLETKVKKKKKKMEVEEAPVVPQASVTRNGKQKNMKKTKQTEAPELEGEEDLSPEEKLVLERKMKKVLNKEAKKQLKTEGETVEKSEASAPIAPQLALDYLKCWSKKRTEWKFQKTRQTWLLQHMFDSAQIPDKNFSVLLEYMEGLQGGAKDLSVQKALALVEESGKAPEDGDLQQRAHRAREVIQLLS